MKVHSFQHKGLKRLYEKGVEKGIPAESRTKVKNMLAFLDAMSDPQELKTPVLKWKAHELGSNRAGTWALSVTANWRLTFRVDDQNRLCDLNLEDYH
jgi:proteic killer suppression protein